MSLNGESRIKPLQGLAFKLTAAVGLGLGLMVGVTALVSFLHRPGDDQAWAIQSIVLALATFILGAGLTGFLTTRWVSRPLILLSADTRLMSQGHYDYDIPPTGQDEIGLLTEALDQTRRAIKKKTEALDESSRQFQTLFEQVPCYVSVQDRDFRLVAYNKLFERDFGHKPGQPCYLVYKGRQTKCPDCSVEKTFQDGQIHSAEEVVIGQDGARIHFLNLAAPIIDNHGRITSVMEMSTDVTLIRQLEEELLKTEEKYRLFFNHDPNTIFILDRDTYEILDCNQRAAAMYGYDLEDLVDRSFLTLTSPRDETLMRIFLAAGEPYLARVRQVRADGAVFTASLRASYWDYMERRAVILSAADITKWLLTENQLIQASKMATLGEMSAGVAHEINQPLSVIGTAGNFLRKQLNREAKVDYQTTLEVAEEILAQVQRATRIINHLREFGRKAAVDKSLVDLNQPIQGVFHLLGQQMKVHNVQIETDLAPDLPPVWGDLNRLEQVFINLVINARDAIQAKAARDGAPSEGWIRIATTVVDGQVVATISDNGVGIPAEEQARIFEPFYTTKQVGKGTGLGLSISYGIVRDFGGSIQVESEVGAGTTFRLSFPAADKESQ